MIYSFVAHFAIIIISFSIIVIIITIIITMSMMMMIIITIIIIDGFIPQSPIEVHQQKVTKILRFQFKVIWPCQRLQSLK